MGYENVENWRTNGGIVNSDGPNSAQEKYVDTGKPRAPDVGPMRDIAFECAIELTRAIENWPPMNSAHEGYGVLLEEMDELWTHVKNKSEKTRY